MGAIATVGLAVAVAVAILATVATDMATTAHLAMEDTGHMDSTETSGATKPTRFILL